MIGVQKYLAILLLLVSWAAAQNGTWTASVQHVTAVADGADLRVEVTLTSSVDVASVETAVNPDRILIDLPGTTCNACTQNVSVSAGGIRRVRTGQHSTKPMITRVVVDLDQAHPYTLRTEGNRVILTVGPAENAHFQTNGAPVAATSGNLIGVFRRKREAAPPVVDNKAAYVPPPTPPPTPTGPSFEPSSGNTSATPLPAPPPQVAPPVTPSVAQSHPASVPAKNPAPASAAQTQIAAAKPAAPAMPAPPPAIAARPSESLASPRVEASTAPVAAKPASTGASDRAAVSPKTSEPAAPVTAAAVPERATSPAVTKPKVEVATVPAPPVPAVPSLATGMVAVNRHPPAAIVLAPAVPAAPSLASGTVAANRHPPAAIVLAPAPTPAATETREIAKAGAPAPVAEAVAAPAPESASPSIVAETAPSPSTNESASPADAAPEAALVIPRSDDPSLRTVFKVKYVAEGVAYLEGGRGQGLSEGMKLEVEDSNLPARQGDSKHANDPKVVAELEVTAVAESSAVTEIHTPKRPVKVGDLAYLSNNDAESLVQQRALSATRQYPAVISFTEGDTLDEEVRAEVPRPPLPSVNRARGRIGFDTIETISHGLTSVTSTDVAAVFRGDMTRIGGTYWNLSGYWRGQLTKESAASQQTLQSLLNRTYHLNLTYDNPNSDLVAGFGRLFLPWAPSLDTLDGGYFGYRLSRGSVLGVFGGSTPDPSSWDYSPDRAIGGAFINFEGGDYSGFHYSATTGAGLSMINWAANDPFVFFEDSVSYKRDIAVYESAQLDSPKGNSQTPSPGAGLGRNFFTVRVNPFSRLELDANYNYFRQVPTFNPTLIGTGLLDKYLFQGFSAGARFEIFKQVWLSTNLGRSSGTGDSKTSLNQMYGITVNRVPWINLRADLRYSQFSSSFGTGSYDALSLSRQLSDRLRIELLVGQQVFASQITANTRSKFLTGTFETTLGPHYYLQSNFTTNRGDLSYDQLMFSMGYRFDSKRRGERP